MSSQALERTLGLSELARAWAERLQKGPGHDGLVVVAGPPELLGFHFPLDRAARRILIGRGSRQAERAPGEEIRLDSPFVSAPHAALEAAADGWLLVDLDSSNHTYLGTVRVERQRLVYGDELRLGDLVLLFISAEAERLPSHVLDGESGLLGPRVFEGEAVRLGARPGLGGPLALLLLRCPGLGEQRALLPSLPGLAELPARIGAALLATLPVGAVLGRLQGDLFAGAFRGPAAELGAVAARASAVVQPLCGGLGLPPPRVAFAGQPVRLPSLLAACLAALEAPGAAALVEVDAEERPLLRGAALLAALLAAPELPLLVLAIADEDGLRHRLGNAPLEACRWRLRRLGARLEVPLVGWLEERVLLIGCPDAAAAARLAEELAGRFAEELAGAPELAGEGLRATLLAPVGRRTVRRGRELRRLLLELAEGPALQGERLGVDRLPAPLAAPYLQIWAVGSETGRLRAVLQAAEMAARFLACLGVAALGRWASPEAQARLRPLLGRLGRPALPLGEWVGLLRELPAPLGELRSDLAGSLAGMLGGEGQPLAGLLERRLLPARNAFAHGGAAPGAEPLRELLGDLNQLLRRLAPLEELPLVALQESRPRRGGGLRAALRLLSGPGQSFELREVEMRLGGDVLFPGSVYLCSEDYREALELQPLLRLHTCPRCDREEIFVVEGLPPPGSRLELRAVSTGHPLRWLPALEELPEGLLGLLGGR